MTPLSDNQIIALARSAPVVSGWRFFLDIMKLTFRKHKMQNAKWILARQVFITADSTSMKDPTPICKPCFASMVGQRGKTGDCRDYLINLDTVIYIADFDSHRLVIDGEDKGIVPVVRLTFAATDEGGMIEEKFIIANFDEIMRLTNAVGMELEPEQ
jgi:hypothetical protein